MASPRKIRLENVDVALSPEALIQPSVKAALVTITTLARDHWMGLAMSELRTSKDDYIAALREFPPEINGMTGRVFLSNKPRLAGMLEEGRNSWDLRETVLGGPRTKVSATTGRRYVSVPFRHYTPGHGTFGRVMGAEGATSKLGRSIYSAARKLLPYSPGLLGQLFEAHPDVERSVLRSMVRLDPGTGGAEKLREHHTTDVYAGMVRQVQQDGGRKSSHYTTWRTISDRNPDKPAPPESWRHPGLEKRDFASRVASYVESQWAAVVGGAAGGEGAG